MSKEDIALTGYCGLYCADCNRFRSRAADLAEELLAELESRQFDKYAEVKSLTEKAFEKYPAAQEVLQAIAALQCRTPCRVGGGCATFACRIVACCQEKALDGCWQCADFESCSKFDFLKPYHAETNILNLKLIKERGLENWAGQRHKFYPWQ